ncbi:hypothetical protein GCM10009662_20910 [Catellatospora coxensis]
MIGAVVVRLTSSATLRGVGVGTPRGYGDIVESAEKTPVGYAHDPTARVKEATEAIARLVRS